MSKTSGNVVDPFPFIERYGLDALRYYLVREIRFGEDGTFTQEGFEQRYESELANELGNLLNRTVSMIGRYRGGAVPPDPGGDAELAAEAAATVVAVREAMDADDLTRALEAAWVLVRRLNRLVEERTPWTLAKDPARATELDQTLFSLAEGLRIVGLLLWPVMPASCERLLTQLGQPAVGVSLHASTWGSGVAPATTTAAEPLFPRVEPDAAD